MILFLLFTVLSAFGHANINGAEMPITQKNISQYAYANFESWASACGTLPFYKYLQKEATFESVLTYDELWKILNLFITSHKNTHFNQPNSWFALPESNTSLDKYFLYAYVFQPFVQKEIVPAGTKIIFKGDMHGDIHSLIKFIRTLALEGLMDKEDSFKIIDDSLRIVFLGDYTDKGIYGIEVLYTILRLKLANPDQVFLVRGNHEDCVQNLTGGLFTELIRKLANKNATDGNCAILIKRITQMYNFLPACLFLGIKSEDGFINYIQCCHGGMELGHNATPLLDAQKICFEMVTHVNRLQNSKDCACLAETNIIFDDVNIPIKENFCEIGYMWSDFSKDEVDTIAASERGHHIYEYGKTLTQEILKKLTGKTFKVCAVMRAHQHSCDWTDLMELILDRYNEHPEDIGCGKLWREENEQSSFWDGIVCTLMLSPDNPLGNGDWEEDFPPNMFDYWATLSTADDFAHWKLTMSKNNPYENKIE